MALQSAFLIYALCCTDAIILSFVLAVPDEGSTTSHSPEGSREQHHTPEGAASSQRNSMARETYKPKGAAMPCPTSQLIGDQQADGDAHRTSSNTLEYDNSGPKERASKWATSYPEASQADAEKRLGIRIGTLESEVSPARCMLAEAGHKYT